MVKDKSYRLLIVHPGFSKHIRRFIRRLKQYNKDVKIDILVTCSPDTEVPNDISENVDNVKYIKLLRPEKCANKEIRLLYNIVSIKRQIRCIAQQEHYDVINIHFPNLYIALGARYYKKMCNKLLLTPWGSDVYQLNSIERHYIAKLYEEADNVTGLGNRFTRDYQKMFGVPDEKIVRLTIASETADFIKSHKGSITQEEAKEKIGIKGYYGIVCSYNGNPIGNHIKMFDAIKKIKDEIPVPIMILVQITYGYTVEYLNKLKNYINNNNLNAIFFDKYLSQEDLYCLMMSADMFIFVPDSDSNSGVLKEYISLGKKVILGEWLRYDDLLECNGLPYFPTKSFDTLSDTIKEAYFSDHRPVDPEWLNNFENGGYDYWMPKWNDYYMSCCKK